MPNRSAKQHKRYIQRHKALKAVLTTEEEQVEKRYRGFGSAWLKRLEEMESTKPDAHPPEQSKKGGDICVDTSN